MPPSRILIVEDELPVAADIEASLQRSGHMVIGVAATYPDALAMAESHRPDLVLMDVQLRGAQSGVAAAQTIRESWQIPVVFLTATPDEQTIRQSRDATPYGFLTKPFRNEELVETVWIALQQHRMRQELFASHHWLTNILSSLTDLVIATDSEGFVRYMNAAAEAAMGWTHTDAHGRPIEEVCSVTELDGNPLTGCTLRGVLQTQTPSSKRRFLLTTHGGHRIPIEGLTAPIAEDGQIFGAVAIFRDITDRLNQEREQELERDRLEEQALSATIALGQTRAELSAFAGRLMHTQEEERQRIARELHDDLGQQTALLGMLADRISMDCTAMTGDGKVAMEELRRCIYQISTGLRMVSHTLHPSILVDLGLVPALESLVQQERRFGRDVSLHASNVPPDLPVSKATALYRIAQEALRNAASHAAGAAVRITVWTEDGSIHLRVLDTGLGFSPVEARGRGGLGLVSMQERARLAGGNLLLTTAPGQGTKVLVRLPLGD